MSGIFLASALFFVVFVAHLGFSHLYTVVYRELALMRFMVSAGVGYVVAFPVTIHLIHTLTGPPVLSIAEDFATGLAAMGFLTLGYVEFWSLIERSFSLRLLIDISTSQSGLTFDELATAYSAGRGLEWMMNKRLSDLVGSGLLEPGGPHYHLTPFGRTVARVLYLLRRAFRIS